MTGDLSWQALREAGHFDDVSDNALLGAGDEARGALGRGVQTLEVLGVATGTDVEAGTVGFGTSVAILCREHLDAGQEIADQLS